MFDTFKKLKATVENHCDGVFERYYEVSILGTPQQNGITEQMDRTILEHVRTEECRIHLGLPKQFRAK